MGQFMVRTDYRLLRCDWFRPQMRVRGGIWWVRVRDGGGAWMPGFACCECPVGKMVEAYLAWLKVFGYWGIW